MDRYPVAHDQVVAVLQAALEPLDYTHAMWEGGAVAWGRVDAWSDIDLQVDVDDGRVEDTFQAIEQALESLSPIDLRFRMPDDPARGFAQIFYRLRDASPYLLLDIVVLPHSATEKFLEPEIHGPAVFQFDKSGVSRVPHFDLAAWQASRLKGWLADLRTRFDLFQVQVLKELNRGNLIEAVGYYHVYTLRPLLAALNMRYRPARHSFGVRYVYYELPPADTARLERLYLPAGLDDLRAAQAEAEDWFQEVIEELGG